MEINKSEFLEAGVQFGHYKSQTHPNMKKFIFSTKNGVNIIDLKKTISFSFSVFQQVKDFVSSGSEILFVGKKKQASEIVKNAALNCGSPFMVKKWPGGFLTNFRIISREISKLNFLIENSKKERKISKKENSRIEKKIKNLSDCYEGVLDLKNLPDAVFIFGLKSAEKNVVKEALKLGIKIISICDTDTDPSNIDYLIPGNDDGIKSTVFFSNLISRAVKEGKDIYNNRSLSGDNSNGEDLVKEVKDQDDESLNKNYDSKDQF